jgi:hypothetical protein
MDITAGHFDDLASRLFAGSRRVDGRRLVEVAAQVMPHSDHAGVTLIRGTRRPRTIAASDRLPLEVDALQYATHEGPCLAAAETGDDVVLSEELASDDRWPQFGPRCAAQVGVHSLLSVRLALSQEDRAALNFYARAPGAFDDLDIGMGSMLAPYAALVIQQELHDADVTNLEHALSSSRQIGMAVGILMARYRVTDDEAFEMLRTASQHLNRKLRAVAVDVTDTGEIPEPPEARPRAQRR